MLFTPRGATRRLVGALLALTITAGTIPAHASGFSFPSIPGLPSLRLPQNPLEIFQGNPLCKLLTAGAAVYAQKLALRDAQRLGLSAAQSKSRERSYLVGLTMLGCEAASGAASAIVRNMSESAKKAQDEAWRQAQQQTGPVAWSDPNSATRGTTEIVERETMPDGSSCGTRRDVIEAAEGRADPMVRVCRTAGGEWVPQPLA